MVSILPEIRSLFLPISSFKYQIKSPPIIVQIILQHTGCRLSGPHAACRLPLTLLTELAKAFDTVFPIFFVPFLFSDPPIVDVNKIQDIQKGNFLIDPLKTTIK